MTKHVVFSLLVLLLPLRWVAAQEEPILIEMQFFRIMNEMPGDHSLQKKVWTTDEPPEDIADTIRLFDRGQFDVNGNTLEMKEDGLFWNNRKVVLAKEPNVNLPAQLIQPIVSPRIKMKSGSKSAVHLDSKMPIQYFERRQDNLFELKEVEMETGIDIEIYAEKEDADTILLTDLILQLRLVGNREPIEGVNFPVGYPILESHRFMFYFRVESGKDYGLLITPQGVEGALLVRLRATNLDSEPSENNAEK